MTGTKKSWLAHTIAFGSRDLWNNWRRKLEHIRWMLHSCCWVYCWPKMLAMDRFWCIILVRMCSCSQRKDQLTQMRWHGLWFCCWDVVHPDTTPHPSFIHPNWFYTPNTLCTTSILLALEPVWHILNRFKLCKMVLIRLVTTAIAVFPAPSSMAAMTAFTTSIGYVLMKLKTILKIPSSLSATNSPPESNRCLTNPSLTQVRNVLKVKKRTIFKVNINQWQNKCWLWQSTWKPWSSKQGR